MEIGCSTGELLNNLKPSKGMGIEISSKAIELAKNKYPHLDFEIDDIEDIHLDEKFDYIIMQDLLGHLTDVWQAFRNLKKLTNPETRIIISYYNHLWEPLILLAEFIGLKVKQYHQNWLSLSDIENLLYSASTGSAYWSNNELAYESEVKKVAKELLTTLKEEKLVLDWRKRQQSRAAVRESIEVILDDHLQTTVYPKELLQQKCDLVYQHVYDSYFGQEQSIYAPAALS